MTLEHLQGRLEILGFESLQFHFTNDFIEAMVELEDGQFLAMTGTTLTEAAESLLAKLEQLSFK